jgi:hypothetical protein
MTYIQQAIRDAVEKGQFNPWPAVWGKTTFVEAGTTRAWWKNPVTKRRVSIVLTAIFFDPSFWQALGKARGWGIEPSGSIWQGVEQWRIRWHDFIDHLADGKDAESFFNDLSI